MSASDIPPFSRIADNRQAFCEGIAELIETTGRPGFAEAISGFLKTWMPISAIAILEFQRGLQPRLIYVEADQGFDDDLKKYLGGLYLLDPMFESYESEGRTGIVHLSRDSWDHIEAAEYYRSYFRYLGAKYEVGGLYEIDPGVCIHFSLKVREGAAGELDRVIRIMEEQETLMRALCKVHFGPRPEARTGTGRDMRRHLHQEVSRTMRDFGRERLTGREQDIAKLLLRGHSAKSIARILDISPGTASIHRSNVYQKMGVAGQGELFSNFLEQLTGA